MATYQWKLLSRMSKSAWNQLDKKTGLIEGPIHWDFLQNRCNPCFNLVKALTLLNRTELCCVKLTLCLYWLLMELLSSYHRGLLRFLVEEGLYLSKTDRRTEWSERLPAIPHTIPFILAKKKILVRIPSNRDWRPILYLYYILLIFLYNIIYIGGVFRFFFQNT